MENSTVEKKRAEARLHRGVTYDPRIDKFTAAISIDRKRIHIGSFVTAAEAGEAYTNYRAAAPISRRRDGNISFHLAYANFLEVCEKDDYGDPAVGEIFTAPDGQRFCLAAVEFGKRDGKTWIWSIWNSRCRVCGKTYTHSAMRKVRDVRWMPRNCLLHRGDQEAAGQLWPDPENWKSIGKSDAAKQREANRAAAKAAVDGEDEDRFPPEYYAPGAKEKRQHKVAWLFKHTEIPSEERAKAYEKAPDGLAASPGYVKPIGDDLV